MTNIDFFKKQAKLLLKDWQNREQKHFGFNVKELFRLYEVNAHEQPTLMKAQHLLARALGRKSWAGLINDSDESLEYTKNAFIENIKEEKMLDAMWNEIFSETEAHSDEFNEDDGYHGIVECLHCGQRFPIDKPNHLPSCDGEDWDLVPIEEL